MENVSFIVRATATGLPLVSLPQIVVPGQCRAAQDLPFVATNQPFQIERLQHAAFAVAA